MHFKFSFFILCILLLSCRSTNQDLENLVRRDLNSENKIDEEEFKEILNFISQNKSKYPSLYDNGKLSSFKVQDYIISAYPNLELSRDDFQEGQKTELVKNILSVFIENSASLDGYVQGKTNFKQDLYRFLSDLRAEGFAQEINLNYINSKTPIIKENANDDELRDYFEELNPQNFRNAGGNRGSSELSNIFKRVLDKVDKKKISILISDCVFSPGKGLDATNFLESEQSTIKLAVRNKLDSFPDLAILGIMMKSEFNGSYYNQLNQPKKLTQVSRPYYIWIMSDVTYMNDFINSRTFYRCNDCPYAVYSDNDFDPSYQLKRYPRKGNYKIKSDHSIKFESLEERGKDKGLFGFTVELDLSGLLISKDLIQDKSAYEFSEAYLIDSIFWTDKRNQIDYFMISDDPKTSNEVGLSLSFQNPKWIERANISDDRSLEQNNSFLLDKTLGIENMFDGILDAYMFNQNKSDYFNLSISVDF